MLLGTVQWLSFPKLSAGHISHQGHQRVNTPAFCGSDVPVTVILSWSWLINHFDPLKFPIIVKRRGAGMGS